MYSCTEMLIEGSNKSIFWVPVQLRKLKLEVEILTKKLSSNINIMKDDNEDISSLLGIKLETLSRESLSLFTAITELPGLYNVVWAQRLLCGCIW